MGKDKVRHFRDRGGRFYWQPSATVLALGLTAESLGTDPAAARSRAVELNNLADDLRKSNKTAENGPKPGSCSKLFRDFRASEEFADLKPRTRRDYSYYLDKIEAEFGRVMVRALSPKVVKTYYKRVRREKSVTWAYHILSTFRAVLTWAVSEDWIKTNPALDVTMKGPSKRTVVWTTEQCASYVSQASELGWHSIVAMALVFDSLGQSPVDIRTLKRSAYDGRVMHHARAKTGVGGAPIPLFPDAVAALDAYLATRPLLHPAAPLFENDKIGGEWNESTLQKTHRRIRRAAGLPDELQLQDFRTTVQTEGGAAGGTIDELRFLARHTTRDAGEHYVMPDSGGVERIQEKRLALRNLRRQKVGGGS